jgi:Ca2+-binding RTX toxin-like protein
VNTALRIHHFSRAGRTARAVASVVLSAAMVSGGLVGPPVLAAAVVGQGFTVTPADLAFILKQIKIAERHSVAFLGTDPAIPANPNPSADPSYCLSMIGSGPDQIPDAITSYGLRTVDGSCNNLVSVLDLTTPANNHPTFGAADRPFPRLTNPSFRPAEGRPAGLFGPGGPPATASSTYAQKKGSVYDTQPRLISNLIVDQTATNPAAIAAAGFPVRTQGDPASAWPCGSTPPPGTTVLCTPTGQTLFIPNVTTDIGLSPPYNSLFTFFGQFFDHGVDQTVKSGGSVFVPLRADDPLVTSGRATLGSGSAFIVLTRGQQQPGPDGILFDNPATPIDETADNLQDAPNTDTPWVDQSQTYTSHASHQVFLREYVLNAAGRPVSTGKFLGGLGAGQAYPGSPDGTGGISTWAATKLQAATKLGLRLQDTDVTNIPMLATDPYGKFVPGPNGLPQYVTATGLVEGNLATPVPVPANVRYFDTPFLTDIAHNADPSGGLTPDADLVASADFAAQPAGTYDNELLDMHFTCGDGRCNENIALSTIHQIFHSEHDRLVDYIKNVLATDTTASGVTALAQWQLPTSENPDGWNGERLFQAARFVTEMEYQHLVFEEFARKLVPAIHPFHVYSPDVNPAIDAEFAHAVYRFGHSMLDDTVARTNITLDPATGAIATRVDNSTSLLHAFLNPPELFNQGGTCDAISGLSCNGSPLLSAEAGAGAIVMGSSDQVGNELDEFINETLRNNLLGLPLDLATLNITRARSEGIPPLNDVRRQIFNATNDGQLAPYSSWSDYGQHLKHPESLINFVAAYGTHPTIVAATTIAGKRAAARAIVNPIAGDVPPPDSAAFMFGTNYPGAPAVPAVIDPGPDGILGTADDITISPAIPAIPAADWTSVGGVTTTGLDSVDLWDGGLAEVTNLFGSLLGSTFNYVFQSQLEKLQDGDRFYYLARTPGMNLRPQLEGNSFSELIGRNTIGTSTLKADAFATADCKFELGHLNGTAAGFAAFGSSVADDPSTTDCNENLLLLRQPNGTIQYKAVNSVDPVGINGQSVYNGTSAVDRVFGGNDNDTFWGGPGNDVIEGNGGDDVALGGDGNDIITDLAGADVLKGGPGNDAVDGGIGDDIVLGGSGQDFLNGGANDNETFAGPGNDFIIAGQGADAVFGDSGDDWIEGGTGQDLLQGDHGAPFFDDPGQVKPGNDIFVGQPGENDYDAEGGDDLMAANAAIDRNAGAGGFDWAFHQYNTVPANDDMQINQLLVGVPIQLVVNRDRWQETEAISGYSFNDVIRGDNLERVVGPGGFAGCDALDPTGVARITGLDKLVNLFPSSLADVITASTMKQCPLAGFGGTAADPASGTVWAEGNILLGGAGSDVITGRGNNDIIDGDHFLTVRISVRSGVDAAGNPAGPEIGTTDLMENQATSGSFGPGTAGMTLQQAVFAGLVDPGQLVAMRQLPTMGASANTATPGDCGVLPATGLGNPEDVAAPAGTTNCDIATYAAPAVGYTITRNADGSVTVADIGSVAIGGLFAKGDGVDTLWNIESLRFCTANDAVTKKCTAFETLSTSSVAVAAPIAGRSPASLPFGNQVIATTSATQAITVTNTGTANLTVTGATLGGADAASFTIANGCTLPVAPAGSCTISVAFAPTTVGPKSASVSIANTDALRSPLLVTLTGTALAPPAPIAVVAPAALAFGNRAVSTSTTLPITVTNTGTAPLNVTGATVTGANAASFPIANGCTTVAPTASCTINVTFLTGATAGVTSSASLSIAHNAAGSPTLVPLSGTSVAPLTTFSLPAGPIAFNTRAINTNTTKTVLVTNTGTNPLFITSATAPAPFAAVILGTCSAPVAVGKTCKLNVTFTPTARTAYAVTLTVVSSNATNSPRTVGLTGTGK